MTLVNEWIVGASTVAILAASIVLTLGVLLRYFLKVPTDWQYETAVFLIVGSIFMCGAICSPIAVMWALRCWRASTGGREPRQAFLVDNVLLLSALPGSLGLFCLKRSMRGRQHRRPSARRFGFPMV